ncbi:Calycin-like protein [Neocallimastix californiae]|uniref:Calycin-like protein n=1 Tax=Neocallimastix californiae TaxID=1754190 RepID=A0A1Y2DP31_9FUNG|nr:Calycin-like protein [Neocallimastix californiae]|eukprot:ORY60415.1 Calycin-like protein [Neocallimastix californiae]
MGEEANDEKKEEEDDGTFIVGEYNYLKTHAQEREFDDWNGAWKSFYPMITSGKLDDVFASLGDKGDTYKQMYTEGFKTDIVNLIFDKNDNNTITFKYDNGKEVKAEYKYSGYDILEWEKDVYGVFYKFERVDKKSKAPKYLRVCDEYLKTVEKNNVIFAWISDKSFEDAYDTKHWLGFAREEVSIKEIADVFIEEMGEEANDEKKEEDDGTFIVGEYNYLKTHAQEREFDDWNGAWKSFYPMITSGFKTDIVNLIFDKNDNNTITFKYDNGKEVKAEYKYSGYDILEWEKDVYGVFYKFERVDKKSKAPKYLRVCDEYLRTVEKNNVIFAWISDKSFEDAYDTKHWLGFAREEVPIKEIADVFIEEMGEEANDEKKEEEDDGTFIVGEYNYLKTHAQEREFDDWNGAWKSFYPMITSGKLDEVFASLGDKGDTYKQMYTEGFKTNIVNLTFDKNNNNTITFKYDNGKEVKAEYKYSGYDILEWEKDVYGVFYKFERVDKKSKAPKYLRVCDEYLKTVEKNNVIFAWISDKSFEDAYDTKHWLGFAREEVPIKEIADVFIEEMGEEANDEKKEEEDDGTFIVGEYNYLKTHAQEREFDDWNGAWKSFYPMITSGKLDDVFASLGDKGDTYKQMYTEGFKTDIVNLIFDKNDNNTITFKYDNGKEVKAEYKYSGYDILEWEKDVYGVFYKFERVDKKSKAPKYLRVCDEYLKTVEKNNVIFAWISDKSFEDAYDTKHWLGFAREEVSIKEIADVFIEEMGEEANDEKKEEDDGTFIVGEYNYLKTHAQEREFDDWNGAWKSFYPMITSGKLDDVFASLGDKGDTYKQMYTEGFKTDIVNLIFDKNDNNTITFKYDNGKEVKAEYKYSGYDILEWEKDVYGVFYKFERVDKKSKAPKYLRVCDEYLRTVEKNNVIFAWISDKSFEDAYDTKHWLGFAREEVPIKEIADVFIEEMGEEANDEKKEEEDDGTFIVGEYNYLKTHAQEREFDDWNGAWKSFYPMITSGKLDDVFASLGDKGDTYKQMYTEGFKTNIVNLTFDKNNNNTITFKYDNGKEVKAEYKYSGYDILEWEKDVYGVFYKFERVDKKSKAPKYLRVCDEYLKTVEKNNVIFAWISDKSFEDAYDTKRWLGFAREEVPIKEIADVFIEEMGEEANDEKKEEEDDGTFIVGEYNYLKTHAQEREFDDWNGAWKSFYTMITSGKLDEVFASLGDKGDTYKQMYTEGFKTNIDNLTFDKNDNNTITFKYDNGKEVKAEYKYSGYDILEWEKDVYGVFYKFERVDKKSKAPKYLRVCDEYLRTVEKNNVIFAWISDKSFEDAYDTKHWLGFAREEVPIKEIADVFIEEMGEEANDEKKEEEDDGTFIVGEYNYLKTHAQEREFDDWNGAWKSFYPMITSGKLDEVFASLGDKGDTYKQMYTEGFKTNIVNLTFDKNNNNTITFKYDNGKEVKAEYKYSGYDILEWEKDVYGVFYKFERVDKKSKAPKYLRVCDEYLKTVEKNNVIFAWISDKSFEDAYDTKHWLGFAREEVPIKEIADVFIEEMGEEANDEKKEEEDDGTFIVGEYNYLKTHAQEREFDDWNGAWKSFYPMITSGKLDDVFASLGDKGDTYKEMYTEGFKTDIVNLIFDKNDNNTITFKYDNGKEVKAEYKYSGYDILEWEKDVYGVFYKFERVDKKSKAPKYLRVCDEYLKTVEKNNVIFAWISDKSFEDAYDTKHWLGFAREEVPIKEIADVFIEEMGEEAKSEDETIEVTTDSIENPEIENDNSSEEESEDDNLVNKENFDLDNKEKQALFYEELINDCNIEKCNKRFLALEGLMKLIDPDSKETKAFEIAAEYYKSKNCKAIQGLVSDYITSGANSFLRRMSFTFVFMTIFTIVLLI